MPSLARSKSIPLSAALLFAASLHASSAAAQTTAASMDFELSIRSAAMAGAANAVVWGGVLSHWANPATLGSTRGLSYEFTKTQLVPSLADDVFLRSRVTKLGGGGVGAVVAGTPDDIGGVRLDYGLDQGTDENGNPTGVFPAFEKVDSWGVGVNALETLASLTGSAALARLSRQIDVSAGMNFKSERLVIGPPNTIGTGTGTSRDAGVLVRVTPIDRLADDSGDAPVRVDAALGYSRLSFGNGDGDKVVFAGMDAPVPVTRHERTGFAARVAANTPDMARGMRGRGVAAAWIRGLSPLVSVTVSHDQNRQDAGRGTATHPIDGTGFELTIANVFAWRDGSYTDRFGGIDGSTSGWMLALPIGDLAGARYETARIPQSSGLPDVERRGWSAWIDPVAIWRAAYRPHTVQTALDLH